MLRSSLRNVPAMRKFVKTALVLCFLGLTACSDSAPGQESPTYSRSQVAEHSVPTGSSGPVNAPNTAVPQLTDGKHFGFIVAVGESTLTIDTAEFFTGASASAEAVKDGQSADQPNGFYLRNPDQGTVAIPVSPDFAVTMRENVEVQSQRTVTLDEFRDLAEGKATASWAYSDPGHLAAWLTVEDGVVVSAEEQYLP